MVEVSSLFNHKFGESLKNTLRKSDECLSHNDLEGLQDFYCEDFIDLI